MPRARTAASDAFDLDARRGVGAHGVDGDAGHGEQRLALGLLLFLRLDHQPVTVVAAARAHRGG